MPIYRIQVNYTFGVLGKWSNVWHVSAPTFAAAAAAPVIGMEEHLLAILSIECQLKSYLISDMSSDAFFTADRLVSGTFSGAGSLLPLYNSVKAVFPPSDFGRPDVKYFKGIVGESLQTSGFLESAFSSTVDGAIESMLLDMSANATPLCSTTGDVYETVQIQPAVQMRQMHRKRRKTPAAP
jgi:hypothetical protein